MNGRNFIWPLLKESQYVFSTVPQFHQSYSIMLRHCKSNPKDSDTNILLSSDVNKKLWDLRIEKLFQQSLFTSLVQQGKNSSYCRTEFT
jgi:hypothetical protein